MFSASRWVGLTLLLLSLTTATPAAADGTADRILLDPRITESSGLVASTAHPGVLWTHNDSDHPPELFAVAPDGHTVATLTLAGAQSRDWEAMASGGGALWVGDIGDNRSTWSFVRLYRVAEPTVLADGDVPWTEFRLRYPDGPHNAEALLIDPRSQRMYVVTKSLTGAGIYEAPAVLLPAPQINMLARIAGAPPIVTDGAFSADGSRLILVGYLGGTLYDSIAGTGTPVALPSRPQGESVTWADAATVLVGSEGARSTVWRLPLVGQPSPTPTVGTAPTASGLPGDSRQLPKWPLVIVPVAVVAFFLRPKKRGG